MKILLLLIAIIIAAIVITAAGIYFSKSSIMKRINSAILSLYDGSAESFTIIVPDIVLPGIREKLHNAEWITHYVTKAYSGENVVVMYYSGNY